MSDQTRLKLKVDETTVIVSGEVAGAPDVLDHGDHVWFVGKASVGEFKIPRKKGITTCKYVAAADSIVAVDQDLVLDVLDDHEQRTTGQLRLLSSDGEARRASRIALDERRRQTDDLGWTSQHDDEAAPDHLAVLVKDYARKVVDLDPDKIDDLHAYFDELEKAWAKVAALGLAGIEQARRGLMLTLEDERRQRLEATEITVDASGTAMTDEEVEEARSA